MDAAPIKTKRADDHGRGADDPIADEPIADEDESGDIKLQELEDFIFVLCRLSRKDLDSTQTAKAIMGEADVNHDGKINRKEIIECKS